MTVRLGSYLELNDRHVGRTVFIIGAGPQLATLSHADCRWLESQVTIGLNRTCYRVRPTYFLSAYIGQVLLARQRCLSSETVLLHMRPTYAEALEEGIVPLKRAAFSDATGLPRRLEPPEPTLYTKKNAALGATHLALILGARRVVYVGIQQRDALHFYHYDDRLRAEMLSDLEALRANPHLSIDHRYATYEHYVSVLQRPAQEEAARPFYVTSHLPTFITYFDILAKHDVEVYSTVEDSVICDAGGRHRPLESFA